VTFNVLHILNFKQGIQNMMIVIFTHNVEYVRNKLERKLDDELLTKY